MAGKKITGIKFAERTGVEELEARRGFARVLMPLAGNENHVGVLYMGAYAVLAEAAAVLPIMPIIDLERYFPIFKDVSLDFHRPAASDVTAEFSVSDEMLDTLLADLERKGSATYVAEFPMHDADGKHVATAHVTGKLLSQHWDRKG